MTVRWKPLLVLSGLFVMTAVLGVTAIAFVLTRSGSGKMLEMARAERKAGQFDRASIQYRRAKQADEQNARLHEEMADFYEAWLATAPEDKRADLRQERLLALAGAAKYDKGAVAPRRKLLREAIRQDEMTEAVRWARELLPLVPEDPDALFVLADEALARGPAHLSEARERLAALEKVEGDRIRTTWLRARLAFADRDDTAGQPDRDRVRAIDPQTVTDPADRMALLRLLAFDIQRTDEPAELARRIGPVVRVARAVADEPEASPGRIGGLGDLMGQVRLATTRAAKTAEPADREALAAGVADIDGVVETTFTRAIAGPAPDLRIYQAYADYLLDRGQHARCLEVARDGLKGPAAALAVFRPYAMGLREAAIRAALADTDDPSRFDKAAPFIKEMIAGGSARDQGIGHLFQGAIDLERSGLAGGPLASPADAAEAEKARAEALAHLKKAASELPNVSTAQALYGVTLILSREPALGRQYLQAARRLGPLETKYQVWAAWSIIQAGYPEEAQPIVAKLAEALEAGTLPRTMEGTIRLLEGEVSQARKGPDDLKRARADYEKALAANPDLPVNVGLRLAQLDIQQKDFDAALTRLAALKAAGKGGPGLEQLTVVAYQAAGRDAEARAALEAARAAIPESGELAILDATLALRAGRAAEAERTLAAFLERRPDHAAAATLRAQILGERLDRADEARKALRALAEAAPTSDAWIGLAEFELSRKNYPEMARAIAEVRRRWPEAAAADLLDAQLALTDRRDFRAAAGHLDAALKKDPDNKVALFWKAQIDELTGAPGEATKVYEDLVRDRPVKELDSGLSLTTAAQWALATQALESRDLDAAIDRFGSLLKGGGQANATLARAVRWKLADAQGARGSWPAAKAEIVGLLKDPATTADEKVRAANYFRANGEEAVAVGLLDGVLQAEPGHSAAVVARAYLLSQAKQADEAADRIRRAIATSTQPPAVHLMLAALENDRTPRDDARRRALAAIDHGLESHPAALELIKARFRLVEIDDPAAALADLEGRAQGPDATPVRRLLAEVYRERGDFDRAERSLRDLIRDEPKDRPRDPSLVAQLVRLVLVQAAREADRGAPAGEKALDEKAAALIRQARQDFPREVGFPRAEWEMAMRKGDLKRALAISEEIDATAPGTTLGPMLRAQVYAAQGRTPEIAGAYAEALDRDPRRTDIKLLLAQTNLALNKADDALRLAGAVADTDKSQQKPAALIKAKALAAIDGPPAQVAARREQAVALLKSATAESPQFVDAYHVRAEIERQLGRRAQAVSALEEGLRANPDDATGLSLLVQLLAEAPGKDRAPAPADLARAQSLAEEHGGRDERGGTCLALAVGFQRAKQYELAIPWAEKAAERLATPEVHMNLGGLYLAQAERITEPDRARDTFRRAVAAYDKVLAVQAGNVEAVNNKAWILHRDLDDNPAALALAEGLLRRADPSALPAEFYDTLGAIREKAGRPREAEEAYNLGLRKSPDHPILNVHMARLLAADPARGTQAASYLRKAHESADALPPALAAELAEIDRRVAR